MNRYIYSQPITENLTQFEHEPKKTIGVGFGLKMPPKKSLFPRSPSKARIRSPSPSPSLVIRDNSAHKRLNERKRSSTRSPSPSPELRDNSARKKLNERKRSFSRSLSRSPTPDLLQNIINLTNEEDFPVFQEGRLNFLEAKDVLNYKNCPVCCVYVFKPDDVNCVKCEYCKRFFCWKCLKFFQTDLETFQHIGTEKHYI